MTGPSAHGQEPIDRWLADRHHHLHDGLGRFLDPEAGLREAMLPAEHSGILGDLGNRLDTEAGLAAILQPPQDLPQKGPGITEAIAAADPAVRITLRRHPVILATILSDLLARSLAIVNKHDRDRDPEINRALARAHDIAFALDRDIARYIADARARIVDRDIARDITHALSCAIDLDRPAQRAYNGVINRAYDEALALSRTRGIDRDTYRRASAHSEDVRRVLKRGLTDAGVRDLYEAKRAINDAAFRYSHHFVTGPTATVALDLVLARDVAQRVALVVGRRLGVRNVEGLAVALLDGALDDDFTRADLSHADLTGVDLTGVRWADPGTQWPAGTDIEALRARSRLETPGESIYVIAGPDGGPKVLRPTPA